MFINIIRASQFKWRACVWISRADACQITEGRVRPLSEQSCLKEASLRKVAQWQLLLEGGSRSDKSNLVPGEYDTLLRQIN